MWVYINQSMGDPIGTKKQKSTFALHSVAGTSIFSCPQASELLVPVYLDSGTYTSGSPSSQAFWLECTPLVLRFLDLNWDYNIGFLESPACRWQTEWLIPIINLLDMSLRNGNNGTMCSIASVSLENLDKYSLFST